ncbi:MAG TPA: anti-sigma factor [Candidatus Limnocylindria bacterium]
MSGMIEHPEPLLSAYLDDALSQAEHDLVRAHLDGCQPCREQLADLRATSRLVGGLPHLAPRRSLVPRLERAPVWLRPVRLLGAMGSGLFVFLFIASAVVNSGASLGGGASTAEQLAEKGQFGAAVNALASDAARQRADSATAAPAANAPVPAAAGAAASQSPGSALTVASPTPATAFAPSQDTGGVGTGTVTHSFGPPPQLFLLIAVLFAIAAFVAHRRLHRA